MTQHYESDITQFIKLYKQQHQDVEKRRDNAGLFTPYADAQLQEQYRSAQVCQKPYVYQTD